jgi:hypothetical protein
MSRFLCFVAAALALTLGAIPCVAAPASLINSLTADRAVVPVGEIVVYTLVVSNPGPDSSSNFLVEINVGGDTRLYFFGRHGLVCGPSPTPGIRCGTPPLAGGATATGVVYATADAVPGTITVTAKVTSASGTWTGFVSTPVISPGPADLVTATAADAKSVLPGQLFVTNFTVTNIGADTTADTAFDVVLSHGLTLASVVTSGGTCAATHCSLGPLTSGASSVVSVTASAPRPASEWIRGAASTSSPQPSTDNDAAQVTVNVATRSRAVRH